METVERLRFQGQWTEWSSCMKNGSCDSSRIRVRRKYCGTSVEDLCASHTEIVETRPCLCPLPDFIATLTTSSLLLPARFNDGHETALGSSPRHYLPLCVTESLEKVQYKSDIAFANKAMMTSKINFRRKEETKRTQH
ncbi:SEA domain-containing protein [Caerostris extrusa]|uniref:SEA domain-containing protein n=1 Tax=Caerostris extrusa TaxID=172846 RepID=A0AAV4TCD7_CAEEX|nr:SEA domain-containing protein [Caerostris extrusa]